MISQKAPMRLKQSGSTAAKCRPSSTATVADSDISHVHQAMAHHGFGTGLACTRERNDACRVVVGVTCGPAQSARLCRMTRMAPANQSAKHRAQSPYTSGW